MRNTPKSDNIDETNDNRQAGGAGATDGVEPAALSRDPRDYRTTRHFLSRADPSIGSPQDTRVAPSITGDVIEKLITCGECKEAFGDERYQLTADVDGIKWVMIVALHDECKNDVLTCYAPAYHTTAGVPGGDAR